MARTYDIAVLGATAAGYAAAVSLARADWDVAVISAPASPVESPLSDWIPADLFDVCPELRPAKSSGTQAAFRAVRFHSQAFDRESTFRGRSAAGFFVRAGKMLAAMARAAGAAGVAHVTMTTAPRLDPQESLVTIEAGRRVRASLLLIAQDSPARAVARLVLPARSVPISPLAVCGMDIPLSPAQQRFLDKDLHVAAAPGNDRLGLYFAAGAVLHVRIISGSLPTSPRAGGEALSALISAAQQAGALPERLNIAKASAALWRPPGGVALELESHLAKRTLLIGTAGGFASALSGQTIAPGVASAVVAAEVAARALNSDGVQDVLSQYKTLWRDPLADRIRQPGTSVQMLLPMALTNKSMTSRFARAFLYGEAI